MLFGQLDDRLFEIIGESIITNFEIIVYWTHIETMVTKT